ncbi:dienelactone hydrolase family protein [Bradyrhizobium sp. LjRoot220]|uniref:dienelactone hydrolase family protein n=1 Tax=Bradyrhizobium sp. LjRoot220 TaxID=3342284 RepID=UPI003ECF22F4
MSRLSPQLVDTALAVCAAATAASAQTAVNFNSLDGTTKLTAHLSRPEGDLPRPAVVLMHGCSGLLDGKGRILGLYRAWQRALVVQGYVTLTVDSTASRGLGQTCTWGPDAITMWRDRPKDAYAALQYLQAQSFVQADRVALAGWSQGGGVALLTINDKSTGRPADLARDFKAAVSFYPGACAEQFQSKPFTEVEPNGWTTKVPLLVLIGEADVWTPFKPCGEFIAAAKARGNPVELKSYPSAVHAFDAPDLPRTELPAYRMRDGQIPVIGTDREARADAFVRVLEFMKRQLESN